MEYERIISEIETIFIRSTQNQSFYSSFFQILKDLMRDYNFELSIVFTSPHNPTFHWQPVYRSTELTRMENITAESFKSMSQGYIYELLETGETIYVDDIKSLDLEKYNSIFYQRLKNMKLTSFLLLPLLSTNDRNPIGWIAVWNYHDHLPLGLEKTDIDNLKSLILSKDISSIFERLRLKEIYEDLAKNYSELIETSDDLVLIRSKSGLILQINDFVEKLGFKKSDFIGKKINEVEINGQKVFVDSYILESNTLESVLNDPDHRLSAPIFDSQGNLHILEGTVSNYDLFEFPAIQIRGKDVTKLKKLEADIRNSQRFEALTTLARGIAHDVNNLMQAISGNVTLLRNYLEDKEKAVNDEAVFSIISDLESIINNSEKFSKRLYNLTSDEYILENQPIEVVGLLTDISKFYLAGSSIELDIQNDDSQLWIEGDAHIVTQIVSNIILNARDALKDIGSPTISLDFIKTNTSVKISIRDNGPGIPEDLHSKILLPYFTTKSHGSGLGLSTAFARVKAMNGNLTFTSELGKTIFTIEFPLVDPSNYSDFGSEDDRILHPKISISEKSISMLIVDDESVLLNSLKTFLTAFQIQTYAATTYEEAAKIFQEQSDINCLLVDFHLKPGNGSLLIHELNQIRRVRSILYTGSPESIDHSKLKTKPDRIIAKPILLDDLLIQIQDLMK